MKIILSGPKATGKSTKGKQLAALLDIPFVETDELLESLYAENTGSARSCREICRAEGEAVFRQWENRAVEAAAAMDWCVISTGGATLLNPLSRRLLRRDAILVLLQADPAVLWKRISRTGIPAYLKSDDPAAEFAERVRRLIDVVTPYADILLDTDAIAPADAPNWLAERIAEEVELRSTSFSTAGEILRVHTFGESHGAAIGAVVDGVPPGLSLDEADIQPDLDRRRPGQSKVATPRKESDTVRILSGVFEGKTTGASIGLLIENKTQISSHYDKLRDLFRPGHADFTFWSKYGRRDHRGGGRASGRETACRVAGGTIAKKILAERGVTVRAYAAEIAGIQAKTIVLDTVESNPVRCPDPEAAVQMEKAILEAKDNLNSVGGVIQLEVTGLPAGVGDPVFAKLDARLAGALFSIGTVKGVEIGDGFAATRTTGIENNDAMRDGGFATNHAGGILGGMSNGQPITARVAIKPTPSVSSEQQTCDVRGGNVDLVIGGRHDPCIVPRAVPVVEAMAALVILDAWMIQERLRNTNI